MILGGYTMIKIIDTFNEYRKAFENNLEASIDDKINIWDKIYISKYPELERKCKEDYESLGYDWKSIGRDMVFNRTKIDFNKMIEAHYNINEILDDVEVVREHMKEPEND